MNSPIDYLLMVSLIALTVSSFIAGLYVYRKTNQFPLLHPLVTSAALIALILKLFNLDYVQYLAGNQLFFTILGPATVALAIPLHKEFKRIKQTTKPIVITLILGAIVAPCCAVMVGWLLGGSEEVLAALLTKSVSTPIALDIAEISTKAHVGLVTGVVVFTAVVSAIAATPIFSIMKITDPRVQGLTLGINGHAAGTTKGFEISETCGAFSSLALGLTGCITAILIPLIYGLFQFLVS